MGKQMGSGIPPSTEEPHEQSIRYDTIITAKEEVTTRANLKLIIWDRFWLWPTAKQA